MAVIATYGLRGHEVWQRISQRGALLIATEEGAWDATRSPRPAAAARTASHREVRQREKQPGPILVAAGGVGHGVVQPTPVPWRSRGHLPAAAVNQGHNFQRRSTLLRAGPLQAAPLGQGLRGSPGGKSWLLGADQPAEVLVVA